jgi:hypothetical protein
VRGYLTRKQFNLKKSKKSSRRQKLSARNYQNNKGGDNEMMSRGPQKSGDIIFKGGGMPERNSVRTGLEHAKPLKELPDYSSFATRETEKSLGPFIFDQDESNEF